MSILNTKTIDKVIYVAQQAHEDCALTTLKNAKAGITNRMLVTADNENSWEGVNRAEVLACFEQPMDCYRKDDFTRRLELLLETMRNMRIENTRNFRVQSCIKLANRDYGVWLTREQVLKAAAGNHLFNFTSVAKLLAEQIKAAEAAEAATKEEFEITIKGSIGVDNPFHTGDVVYFGSKLFMKATVTKLPKVGDVIRATDTLFNETDDRVKVREVLNDCPPRPENLEQAFKSYQIAMLNADYGTVEYFDLQALPSSEIYYRFGGLPLPERVVDRFTRRFTAAELAKETGVTIQCAFETLCGTDFDVDKARALIYKRQREVKARHNPEAIIKPAEAQPETAAASPADTGRNRGRPRKVLSATFIKQTAGKGINHDPFKIYEIHLNNGKRYRLDTTYNVIKLFCGGDNREYFKTIRDPEIARAIFEAVRLFNKI